MTEPSVVRYTALHVAVHVVSSKATLRGTIAIGICESINSWDVH